MRITFSNIIKKYMNLRKILSVYEVVFGIAGIGMMFFLVGPKIFAEQVASGGLYAVLVCIFVLAIVFYSLSILAGILLFQMKQIGKSISIILHALQIPVFIVAGVEYLISLGLSLPIYFTLVGKTIGFKFNLFIGPQFSLAIGSDGFMLGLNVFAIILLILFMKVQVQQQ